MNIHPDPRNINYDKAREQTTAFAAGVRLHEAEQRIQEQEEYVSWCHEALVEKESRIKELEAALKETTDAYQAALEDIGWETSDGHPASWHALIVSNRAILKGE